MGGKRAPKRQYLFLYSTCLLAILLISSGCATCFNIQARWQSQNRLDRAEQLLRKGDFAGALKADKAIIENLPECSPGDQALFHMGMIWAHPENPEKDYNKALACFQQLVGNFPESHLRGEAMVWIGTLKELISYEDRFQALEKKMSDLKKQLNSLKEIDIQTEEKKREESPAK